MLLSQTIGFVKPSLQLLLHGQSDSRRIDQFQQHVADYTVDVGAGDALTQRFGIFDALPLADVFRAQPCTSRAITKHHASTTLTAYDESLKQRRPFTRGTLPAVRSDCLRVFPQSLQIPFILVPTDIGWVRLRNERVPFFSWQRLHSASTVDVFPYTGATKNKHAGIPRIVEHSQHMGVLELAPEGVAFRRARLDPPGEQQMRLAKLSDCCHR